MAFRFFSVPVFDPSAAEADLNGLLAKYRVVTVERQFVDQGSQSFWAICVEYIPSSTPKASTTIPRDRIDYKEKLSPEQFRVFVQLRELRKQLAQKEAVAVYTVFTNEQLAKMVAERTLSKADLAKIEGIGDARVEKYGTAFVEKLTALMGSNRET